MVELPPPDTPTPPTGRTRHPYFMHDMIRRQSVSSRATHRALAERLRTEPIAEPGAGLLFVGQGTSYHAALAARDAANRHRGRWGAAHAVASFDVLDSEESFPSGSTAVVFSASGETALTIAAQQELRRQGVRVVLITASSAGRSRSAADVVVETQYADEASWTHTVSFSAALVAAGVLLDSWVGELPAEGEEDAIAEAVNVALASENAMLDLVDPYAGKDRFLLVASGVCEPSARESALKLREAAGRFAAVVGVEEALHGVLPSVNDRTVVVGFSDTSLQRDRCLQVLTAARQLGSPTLLIDSSGGPSGTDVVPLPHSRRPMPPVLQTVPLQLLSYWTGVAEGRNPDVMGLDEPKQMDARRTFGI